MIWLLLACTKPPVDTGESVLVGETGDSGLPALQSFEVQGMVVDQEGSPLPQATVLMGGLPETRVETDDAGQFSLWYEEPAQGAPVIVAGKQGYRAIGVDYFEEGIPVSLTLNAVLAPDNLDYSYQAPGDGQDSADESCSHCHTRFVADFLSSKHAEAAQNPKLQALYAGAAEAWDTQQACQEIGGSWGLGHLPGHPQDAAERCYVVPGVLNDLNDCGAARCDDPDLAASDAPKNFGSCADCHAPGIEGELGGRNLHDAQGMGYELGVHCDVCHKVSEVDLEQPPGVAGRLKIQRPSELGKGLFDWAPVYFGPLVDVPNVVMGGSVVPQFDEALFCAGCHEQEQPALLPGDSLDSRWPDGLPIHSTYSEWSEGPYADQDVPCQHCHMPADVNANNAVDRSTAANSSITFGFPRPPEDVRRHSFQGPLSGERPLISGALHVELNLEQDGQTLHAQVGVSNMGAGHAIPTGEPMRALILVLDAQSSCGTLQASAGPTLPAETGAWLSGESGQEITLEVDHILWPEASVLTGQVLELRAVRPSGFQAYAGLGHFSQEGLSPTDKGLALEEPVGTWTITPDDQGRIYLDPQQLETGDQLVLSPAWDPSSAEIQALAGLPGQHFAKVLVDSAGDTMVPHHRAVSIQSDNRIAPGSFQVSQHSFVLPESCTDPKLHATLLYRPHPWELANTYGWQAQDHPVLETEQSW
ncbi:MAG: hypothetical protein ACI9VR_000158 [Cognaticolwellia sp.]